MTNTVSAPTIHPNGGRVVVAVSRPDFAADASVGQLWTIPLSGGCPRRLTRGFRDGSPRFSPDGEVLAFIRSRPGKAPQLHIVDGSGGEPQVITDRLLGVEGFDWSPDGRAICFSSREPEEGRYGTVEGVGAAAEDPRLITGWHYQANGLGYVTDRRSQLFVVDVPAVDAEPVVEPAGRAAKSRSSDDPSSAVPAPRQLTTEDADHDAPRWSTDGATILFTASLHEDADSDLRADIFAIPANGGSPRQLSGLSSGARFSAMAGTQSADGRWLYYVAADMGPTGTDFLAAQYGVWVAPMDEPAHARRLSDALTADFTENGDRLITYGTDGVLAIDRYRGGTRVMAFSPHEEPRILAAGHFVATALDCAADAVVACYSDPTSFGDVAVVAGGELERRSDFSAAFRAEAGVIPVQEFSTKAGDGYPVHGWVLLPQGPGPHPVLLNIHGGPFAQYGWGLFDEAQVYAAAGYAVLMCNPRGSAGYGYDHGRSIREAMGTVDFHDVMSFLEGALAAYSGLDGERLGVMGGSYGGYLTAWTISQDHRFKAAIVERGFLDPETFTGTSDIGWFFSSEYTGSDPDKVQAQSPMAQVAKVRTPTLVIHSEQDLRCPLEQGQRYYTALRRNGVDAEMLIFPGENHELSRTGTPHHRKQRFEHILRWWNTHLPVQAVQTAQTPR
ncbi:S9 family peptidase [Arthrobacter terrae]|uniref:S9 family peptidase n=1 Tax=Arthrobacter terrae TaxID=2935737 RepID=UPI001E38C5E5|nr:S9 family peptidase [Arthrobacter terrae]